MFFLKSKHKKLKVLITGSRGFIGSAFIKKIILNNHELRNEKKDDSTLEIYEYDIQYDGLRNPKWIFENCCPKDVDYIVHLGAESSTTQKNVYKLHNHNIKFTQRLVDYCVNGNLPNLKKFIFASSASLYGKNRNTPMNESDFLEPDSFYSFSKFISEQYINTVAKGSDINFIILRLFNVFSEYEERLEDHKDQPSPHYSFKETHINGKHVKLFHDSDKYKRDFIHVYDVCSIILKLMSKEKENLRSANTINVGSGNPLSFQDVYDKILPNIKPTYIDMPENLISSYQKYTMADTTKLLKELEWELQRTS